MHMKIIQMKIVTKFDKKAQLIGCGCPYPRDAGDCWAIKRGYDPGSLPDFMDVWCECDCHLIDDRPPNDAA